MYQKFNKNYTGIGSRETPPEILELMSDIAFKLTKLGWYGRSGSADGADLAFESGFNKARIAGISSGGFTGYLPWNGFNGFHEDANHFIKGNCKVAAKIASELHPAWNATRRDGKPVLSRGAKALHTRNIYQVLGNDLRTPSSLCIFYATPLSNGQVSGGTNTAVQLCIKNHARCHNLYIKEVADKWLNWLKSN